MSHQQNFSDRVALTSWTLYSVALKTCYNHAPKACRFSVTFSPLASLLCVIVLQSNGFVTRQGEFLDALEGNSSSSSEYLEIWLQILPLEKFLAFVRDKIPVFYDTSDTFFPLAIYWVILGKPPSLEILQVFGRFLLYGRETVSWPSSKGAKIHTAGLFILVETLCYARSKRRLNC